MSSPSLPAVKELGPNHVCLDQANADVRKIAKSLPWYGPKHSPHDVPSFYDVSGITENPEVFRMVVDFFVQRYKAQGAEGPTHIAGFDARGFLFGPPIALALNLPFVMIRKAGKLPGVLVSSGKYVTEYSTDETVMRLGSVSANDRVVLIDDLIATGGTALAGFDLVDMLGASVHEFAAMVSLPFLDGVGKIHAYKDGKYKDVSCFTMVDDSSIGPEMCADPPEGTPRVVKAEEAAEWAAKIAEAKGAK
jgi:adenine phosphoribosyltransferase